MITTTPRYWQSYPPPPPPPPPPPRLPIAGSPVHPPPQPTQTYKGSVVGHRPGVCVGVSAASGENKRRCGARLIKLRRAHLGVRGARLGRGLVVPSLCRDSGRGAVGGREATATRTTSTTSTVTSTLASTITSPPRRPPPAATAAASSFHTSRLGLRCETRRGNGAGERGRKRGSFGGVTGCPDGLEWMEWSGEVSCGRQC